MEPYLRYGIGGDLIEEVRGGTLRYGVGESVEFDGEGVLLEGEVEGCGREREVPGGLRLVFVNGLDVKPALRVGYW